MDQNPGLFDWAKYCLLALFVAAALSCSGGGSTPAPTPPAPPPFQPQSVVVSLGARGGATTLISTQAGGWTRNGEPLTSGTTIKGENAASYTLTLANGRWTAEFVPPAAARVQLGTSGDIVAVNAREDGSFALDGEVLSSGTVVSADNGNKYRLVQAAEGAWTAEFVPPAAARVQLGTSGDTVAVNAREDGSFALDGAQLQSGQVVSAGNGNRYALVLGARDIWTAEFVPPAAARVQLGISGDMLLVQREENGSYHVGGKQLLSGHIEEASNGNRYRLGLQSDGKWRATFVTSSVPVQLGQSGGTVLLVPNEDGSFALNGEVLSSGTVVSADNGNKYRLVQAAEGAWTAEFVPPAAARVQLGTSGDTVAVNAREDGSFALDGAQLQSGQVVSAGNGNRYALVLGARDIWTAEFVPPAAARVQLGISGDMLLVQREENGSYHVGGKQLLSGHIEEASNGNRYRLGLQSDGKWRATFVTSSVPVPLGQSGGTVLLVPNEDGSSWSRGGSEFASGEVVRGSNGFQYQLTLGADGWIVQALPMTVDVAVQGSEAIIVLARLEDGTFQYDGDRVISGDTVEADGNTYTLRFASGRWSATFLQGRVTVDLGTRGDSVTLIRTAAGTYEYNGSTVRSGYVVRSSSTGIRYRLSLRNGIWSSSVYQLPTTGGGSGGSGGSGGGSGGGGTAAVADNILEALPKSFKTGDTFDLALKADKLVTANTADVSDVSYSAYYGSGSFEDDTFVDAAKRAIGKILDPIDKQGLADGNDSQEFVARVLIDTYWEEAYDALMAIFKEALLSKEPPMRGGETDEDEAVDDLEDILDDIADLESFKSEYSGNIDTLDGEKIYNARKQVLALGATDNTRYGVFAKPTNAKTAKEVVQSPSSFTSAAFAYSPLPESARNALPSRGTARYSGATWAIDDEATLYTADIELLASLGVLRITATVSDLREADDGSDWLHAGKEVTKIELPVIKHSDFKPAGKSDFAAADQPKAKVVYEEFGGLFSPQVAATFTGQFLGSGADAGDAVIGSWSIGGEDSLKGAYGAEYQSTDSVSLPSSDNTGELWEFKIPGAQPASLDKNKGELKLNNFAEGGFSLTDLYRYSSRSKVDNDETATARFRHTSYTRFGVWKIVANDNVTGKGTFGYSTLARTTYQDDNEELYPRRVSARYTGQTVAVDKSGNLYDGDYLLAVAWDDTKIMESKVEAVISNLRTVSGSDRFMIGGVGVSQIGFTDSLQSQLEGGTEMDFTSPTATTVQYTTGTTETLANATTTHDGYFVGSTGVDGPFGVLGSWSLTKGADDDISGVFGADLEP